MTHIFITKHLIYSSKSTQEVKLIILKYSLQFTLYER